MISVKVTFYQCSWHLSIAVSVSVVAINLRSELATFSVQSRLVLVAVASNLLKCYFDQY